MDPKEKLLLELRDASASAIRAELAVHDIFPSEIIKKPILINTLVAIYFPEDD